MDGRLAAFRGTGTERKKEQRMTELMNHPDLVGSFVTFAMGSFDGQHGRIVAISETQPVDAQDGDVPFVDIKLYDVEDIVEACGPLAYVVHDESPMDRAQALVGHMVRWQDTNSELSGQVGTVTGVVPVLEHIDMWHYFDDTTDLNCCRVTVELLNGRIIDQAARSYYEPWEPPVIDDITEAQLKIAELEASLDQANRELQEVSERADRLQEMRLARERELVQAAMDNDIDSDTLDNLGIECPKMRCQVTVTYRLKGRRYSGNSLDEGFIRSSLDDLDIRLDSDWNTSDTECDVVDFEVDDVELDVD